METLQTLGAGLLAAGQPINLALCLVGVVLGTLIGVLPGIGPAATLAMLLPLTYSLTPLGALIMLAGVYYGAQYGGSTTAILLNMPGEASSVVTAADGYQMARKGRAGAALAVAALASFVAGMLSNVALAWTGPFLAGFAMQFGPAEYFALAVFGLLSATTLSSGSAIKAVGMACLGLLLSTVGVDVNSGVDRLTLGSAYLYDGISFVVLAVGFFAISEIIVNLHDQAGSTGHIGQISQLWPSRDDFRKGIPATLRGTVVGTVVGVLPGGGATLSAFAAYALEKRLSKSPQDFGKGAVQGIAAAESANNAGAQSNLLPLLILGSPTGAVTALMLGALTIHGVTPGPSVIQKNPDLFWGFIASMWIGNVMLLVINLPMVGLWVRLLSVPYRLLFPAILLFCCIGVFSVSNSAFDVVLAAAFGIVGYLARRARCDAAPLALGFVLGPLLETNFRRAMLISGGDTAVLVQRPVSAALFLLSFCLLILLVIPLARAGYARLFVGRNT